MQHDGRGLDRLQAALDAHEEPSDWPKDVCRDAWCGYWERNNGQYFWHRPSDHVRNRTGAVTITLKRVEAGRYTVMSDGRVLGDVWQESGWRERRTRWGTLNRVHPHYVAKWWRCSNEVEEFETRRDAVKHLLWAATPEGEEVVRGS